jgi:GAF domain-containing protein/HAMP domain-containing protein
LSQIPVVKTNESRVDAMISLTPTSAVNAQSVRNAKTIALIGATASAFTAIFYLYLARQFGLWQIYAMSLDVWILAALLLISFILIRRERTQAGVWLILASAFLSFAVGPFMLSGWGLILGVGLAILITLVATQTLSGQQAERAIFLGAAFAVFIIVIDLFGSENRPPAPQIMMIGLSVVVAVSALIFGINFIRQFQQFKVATRLTVLILMIALPLVMAIAFSVTSRAGGVIEQQANEDLGKHSQIVNTALGTWLDLHRRALTELATLPDIVSMDPTLQKPVLVAMAKAYPNLYLVQTTDLNGINIARNDDEKPKDYHDRQWFLGAKAGAPLTYQTLIGRTNGKPALAMSTPIRDASGQIIGVASIVSTLEEITAAVDTTRMGESGYVFVVDSGNYVIAHPDPALTSGDSLYDFSNYPPVAALRQGRTGVMSFTDEEGKRWRAYILKSDSGWGIISQEPEAELLAPLRLFQRISVIAGMAGLAALLIVSWFAIHRTLRPIDKLTETVEAITAGDLSRTAEATSQDEIGVLGRAFNNMTSQLRELISGLEKRVLERTAELQSANAYNARRATQFEAIALTTKAIHSIRNLDELLPAIASVISERFGYYHVGIFLNDENNEFAILSASNSEGGQKMLERGHNLKIGEQGIVGYVAATGGVRVARNVGEDVQFFNNPDLPETKSEIALPIRSSNKVIGVLDAQSTKPDAFSDEDIDVLAILADQVSLAIENASLFETTRRSLTEAETLYRQYLRQAWSRLPREQKIAGYRYTPRGAAPLDPRQPLGPGRDRGGEQVSAPDVRINVPIKLRGETIGNLIVRAPQKQTWTQDQLDLVQAVAERVALSAENARLFDETSRRAERERLVTEITSKIRSTNNPEEMIRTALDELRNALGATQVQLIPQAISISQSNERDVLSSTPQEKTQNAQGGNGAKK